MEKRDLYDINRNLIGKTIEKNETIPTNTYIMVVVIFIQNDNNEFLIQNDNNEFLIQKRSIEKGGKWATTGGHPKAGENSLQGILTEVQEELGIKIENPTLFKQANAKDVICDLYYIKKNIDINEITIQEEEVADVMWASIDEINKLMKEENFKQGHYMMFQDCLEFINLKNT